MFVLKLPPFFSLAVEVREKGGNFKTNMRFTETNPFLYCLSSSTLLNPRPAAVRAGLPKLSGVKVKVR